jgi:hypothetical protein
LLDIVDVIPFFYGCFWHVPAHEKRAGYLQSVPLPMIQRRLQDFGPWVKSFTFKGRSFSPMGQGWGLDASKHGDFLKR